jgi:glyoxylase-like metal-dependent hydrolase (beta-lactamase superfamily II)
VFLTSLSYAWSISGVGEYSFKPVNKKIYVMHGPLDIPTEKNTGFMNNPAIIIAKKGVILVDPGSTYLVGINVLKEIKKITNLPIVAVLNTHVHGDHWLANQAIKEKFPHAKFYASKKMIIEAKNGEGKSWQKLMISHTKNYGKNKKLTIPTNILKDKQKITILGEKFAISVPPTAHTDTDIMIKHLETKTLFTGDNVGLKRFGTFDSTSNMLGNLALLKTFKSMKITTFIPGHGDSGSYSHTVKPFLTFLQIMKKDIEKGYEDGLEDYEIKKTIISHTKAYKDWFAYDINIGKMVNKMYLEVEEAQMQ